MFDDDEASAAEINNELEWGKVLATVAAQRGVTDAMEESDMLRAVDESGLEHFDTLLLFSC